MLVPLEGAPEVVAVIPTLGRDVARLAGCVESVAAQSSPRRIAVVVVLNTPDTVELDRSITSTATILRPGMNLGWAGGLRLGRAASTTADRLWLVQDDMVPEPDCLAALESAFAEDPKLGIVGPLVIDESGRVAVASCGGVLRRDPPFDIDHWYPSTPTEVEDLSGLETLDYVPSRGMLVDLAVWDAVGGMQPAYYPVVWADVDFCRAVTTRTGRGFAIARRARTAHRGQGSTPSAFGQFLYRRHRELFRSRWQPAVAGEKASPDPLPDGLAEAIAAAASSLATDLAVEYTRLSRESDRAAALDQELRDLRASRSWRLTSPLRALRRLGRRR